jgi:hypothetical protein
MSAILFVNRILSLLGEVEYEIRRRTIEIDPVSAN